MNMSEGDNRPIGIFDSGLGGLTVARELLRELPNENLIYLGDTARVPYGGKSVKSLMEFARQDAAFLLSKNVKLIIAACNTVSAVALPALQEICGEIPFLGVIESGVNAAVGSGAGSILVTGTRTTISSGAYADAIRKQAPEIRVDSIACPLLVPLAEEGITSGPVADQILDLYFAPFRDNPPDAILLGCTHYPLFRNAINDYFSGKIKIIDSGTACAEAVKKILKQQDLNADPDQKGTYSCHATDYPAGFHILAERFLGTKITNISTAVLE
jgi:glutamate racemase